MPKTRRIWILADAHIGHVDDGRDGAEWLQLAIDDMCANVQPVDYAINLGDMSHAFTEGQLKTYAKIRGASHIARWYELVGNHDFKSIAPGHYERWIGCPRYWALRDGNVSFFSLPHERPNAAGLFLPEVEAWLRRAMPAAAGGNVIMAAHSFPYDTVEFSTRVPRCMYPKAAVERFLKDVRVDVWLGGHIHMKPRTPAASCVKGGTTFINCASVSHVYGTKACNSFVLTFTEGSHTLLAQCRHHDAACFVDEQSLAIKLPKPYEPGEPAFAPEPLRIPEKYGLMEADEVESFD